MKILITGAKGMLAQAVKEKGKEEELILTDAQELDITNENRVMQKIAEIKPDYIINCAAYTAVDKAEEEYDLAEKINCLGVENLAKAAKQVGCVLVHVSTDYVFNGELDTTQVYTETSATDPVTVYGITKLHGEEKIREQHIPYYIFRTAWLYGEGNNFVRTMLKLGKEKEAVNVVCDQHGSPTYTEDLASMIYEAIHKKIPYGIYHATNLGYTTWYDFTKEIFKQAGISCKVNAVTSEEFVRPAKRPKNSMLSKDKLLVQGITIPMWQEALSRYLKKEL